MKFLQTEFRKLKAVLDKWTRAIEKYRDQSGDRSPWHYRERSWVGFLAAGAWLAGGVALEEWCTEKQRNSRRKTKGRADLYIGIGGKQFDFEAKHGWWMIRKNGANTARIEQLRKKAVASTSELTMKGSTLHPTVFATVHFPKTKVGIEYRKRMFKEALANVLKDLHPLAHAYVMDRHYENGIALFIWKHQAERRRLASSTRP
jgi:hypothetical protein